MKICRALLLLLCTCLSLGALEVGKHYDFYEKSGQNLLGAELLSETEGQYVVKLKYVPKPITIHSSALARPPELSRIQPKVPPQQQAVLLTKDFVLHASGGFSYTTFGPLSSVFQNGFQMHTGADWLLFKAPLWRIRALTALAGASFYEQAPRRIQLVSGFVGPKFLLWSHEAWGAAVFASPLAGISHASLKGYTFTSEYLTFSAMAVLSFEKRVGPVFLAAQLHANYLFDSSLNFASTGISMSVLYPLADAKPF